MFLLCFVQLTDGSDVPESQKKFHSKASNFNYFYSVIIFIGKKKHTHSKHLSVEWIRHLFIIRIWSSTLKAKKKKSPMY